MKFNHTYRNGEKGIIEVLDVKVTRYWEVHVDFIAKIGDEYLVSKDEFIGLYYKEEEKQILGKSSCQIDISNNKKLIDYIESEIDEYRVCKK